MGLGKQAFLECCNKLGGVDVTLDGEETVADSGLQHGKETLASGRNGRERERRRGER
jgi:hypothetical protein